MPELNFADMPMSPLMRLLGLVIDGYSGGEKGGCTRVRGHIDAGPEHHQPMGIVHGALYMGAIETAASVGAFLAVQGEQLGGGAPPARDQHLLARRRGQPHRFRPPGEGRSA